MTKSDNALYRCDQIKACEEQAMSLFQLTDIALMSQAGTEAFFFITRAYPKVKHIAIFCGGGNNAGDGYALAKLAHEQDYSVIVYQCKAVDELPEPAKHFAQLALDAGVDCQWADDSIDNEIELIVDALLGIGLKGPVHGVIATAIQQINASGLPVLSLDIPSGLNADTGEASNSCVKANATMTFIARKAGMYTLDGPDHCGAIQNRSLQLNTCVAEHEPHALLLDAHSLPFPLKKRKKNTHKGDFGHVLIIGGGPGMPGAATLCAKAALRAGAGVVTVATWPDHAMGALTGVPEAMVWGIHEAEELEPLLEKATVCILGPGLGETQWARSLYLTAIKSMIPMIIDASALRLLAEMPQLDDNWILTPHPGEAAALLSCSIQDIQNDRYNAVRSLQNLYGGVIVLKGAGSLIQGLDKNTFVCPKGNPGMASAGMGDVLSGIIAGFCAQGLSLSDATKLGVWIHAVTGDKVAETRGEVGIVASDLLDILPSVVNEL